MASRHNAVVALCMPILERVESLTLHSNLHLVHQSVGANGEPLVRHFADVTGKPVDKARNILTAGALTHPDVTHVLWVDADMTFDADSLEKLLDHDRPIVGGLCYNRSHPYQPIIAREFDPSWAFASGTLGWLYDHPPEGLIEVDATGAAFLLVRREVFEKIGPSDWWTPMPPVETAEDFSFCFRARAAGFKIAVDCGLRIGHRGEVVVDQEFSRKHRIWHHFRWQPPLGGGSRPGRAAHLDPASTLDPAAVLVPFRRDELDADERPIKPVATCIIPTFNQKPEFLRAAIQSALAQTVPVEVIVVDDGSASPLGDDRPLVEGFCRNLHVVRHPTNRGISAALNTGINHATTDWLCWLSSDDLWEPHKVEAQLWALKTSGMLCGFHNYNIALQNGRRIGQPIVNPWRTLEDQRAALARGCLINGSTTMIHRSAMDSVVKNGVYYDTSYHYSQDWELWCRLGARYPWHYIAETLGTRREGDNLTELLIKEQGPRWARKLEEDRLIRECYAPPDFRALLAETLAVEDRLSPALRRRVNNAMAWGR